QQAADERRIAPDDGRELAPRDGIVVGGTYELRQQARAARRHLPQGGRIFGRGDGGRRDRIVLSAAVARGGGAQRQLAQPFQDLGQRERHHRLRRARGGGSLRRREDFLQILRPEQDLERLGGSRCRARPAPVN